MVNKIFLATVIADVLFFASGILELSFCLVVRSQMDNTPSDGQEATRNLLHQRFPLTAGIVNAAFILVTFVATLPGLFMPTRGVLKIGGYMVTFCAIFTMCVGVFLWVMTLKIREEFSGIYLAQDASVQSLIQTSVCFIIPYAKFQWLIHHSLNAAATSTARHLPLSRTPSAPVLRRPRFSGVARHQSRVSQMSTLIMSSQSSLVSLVSSRSSVCTKSPN